jgi:hypothetical protein
VATAIEKLSTIERQQEQKRLQQEFAFARDIQNSFLPQQLPRQSGLSFAAHYRPAVMSAEISTTSWTWEGTSSSSSVMSPEKACQQLY